MPTHKLISHLADNVLYTELIICAAPMSYTNINNRFLITVIIITLKLYQAGVNIADDLLKNNALWSFYFVS